MSNLVGMLRGRKIYEDDPNLWKCQCDVSFVAVHGNSFAGAAKTERCDYCRKLVDKCGCGACK